MSCNATRTFNHIVMIIEIDCVFLRLVEITMYVLVMGKQ